MGPSLSFGVRSVSVRDADRLGGCGTGVFIGAEVDGEGGKGSGVTTVVDMETILETIISYLFTYVQSDIHAQTQVHAYIPWIHKSVKRR